MRPVSLVAAAAAVAALATVAVVGTDDGGSSATTVSADYPDFNNYDPPSDDAYERHL